MFNSDYVLESIQVSYMFNHLRTSSDQSFYSNLGLILHAHFIQVHVWRELSALRCQGTVCLVTQLTLHQEWNQTEKVMRKNSLNFKGTTQFPKG